MAQPQLPAGLQARFTHRRYPDEVVREQVQRVKQLQLPYREAFEHVALFTIKQLAERGLTPHPKGGDTVVDIIDQQGELVATGYAGCCPEDTFSRKIGRDVALGRALKKLQVA